MDYQREVERSLIRGLAYHPAPWTRPSASLTNEF